MAPPSKLAKEKMDRSGWFMVFVAFGVVPVVVLMALAWIDFGPPERDQRPPPMWVNLGAIRATSADGVAVKTNVVIDAASSTAKMSIERNLSQVGLVLQTSLASKTRGQLTGQQGLLVLSEDMLNRLNHSLGQIDIAPAKAVVLQDFLIGSP